MRVTHLEFDSFYKPNTSVPAGWTPLHYTDKKIYVANGSLELEYKNAVVEIDSSASEWHLKKARVYIPSPAGNVGTAELVPSATSAAAHKFLVYHYDHLGSIQAITNWNETSDDFYHLFANDASGKESLYSYDPWGQRRDPKDWKGPLTTQSASAPVCTWAWDNPATTTVNEDDLIPRGFTGHEMLDDLGSIIHMNGRIYDALLSRFLSADQVIQTPFVLQSYNRYSYAFNNPLRFQDYSGYAVSDEELDDLFPLVIGPRDSLAEIERKLTVNAELREDYASRGYLDRFVSRQIHLHENLNAFNNEGATSEAAETASADTVKAEVKFSAKVMAVAYGLSRLLAEIIIADSADDAVDPQQPPSADENSTAQDNRSGEETEKPNYPRNPDEWTPPEGVSETTAGEKTDGKHRQWRDDKSGEIVRRWDREGREGGTDRGPHWHDSSQPGEHIEPDDILPEPTPPPAERPWWQFW